MKVGAMTKARIGFAVGLGIGIGLVEAAIFYHVEIFQRNVEGFCFVAAATGFLGWLVGGSMERKGMEASPVEALGAEQTTGERPLTLLSGLKYFGLTLMVSTGPLCTLDALRHNQPAVAPPILVKARAAVVFPPLELEGLVRNGAKSSAIINGHVVFVGEGIGEVVLLGVRDEEVTVGLGGETKVLALRK